MHMYLLLLLALFTNHAFCSLAPDQQPTTSGSAGSQAIALAAPQVAFEKPNFDDLTDKQKKEMEEQLRASPHYGIELLSSTIQPDTVHLEMLGWCIARGVDVNAPCKGMTPLHKIIVNSPKGYLQAIKLLMQANVLLSSLSTETHVVYTIPQIVTRMLSYIYVPKPTKYQKIRNILRQYSQDKFSLPRKLKNILINNGFIKALVPLVQEYYMSLEPSYEQLEAMPVENR